MSSDRPDQPPSPGSNELWLYRLGVAEGMITQLAKDVGDLQKAQAKVLVLGKVPMIVFGALQTVCTIATLVVLVGHA